LEEKNQLRL